MGGGVFDVAVCVYTSAGPKCITRFIQSHQLVLLCLMLSTSGEKWGVLVLMVLHEADVPFWGNFKEKNNSRRLLRRSGIGVVNTFGTFFPHHFKNNLHYPPDFKK